MDKYKLATDADFARNISSEADTPEIAEFERLSYDDYGIEPKPKEERPQLEAPRVDVFESFEEIETPIDTEQPPLDNNEGSVFDTFEEKKKQEADERTISRGLEREGIPQESSQSPSSVDPFFEYKKDDPLGAAKMIGNIPTSAAGLAKDIYGAVTSPVQTAKGLGNMVFGGLVNLSNMSAKLGGEDVVENFEKFKEKYPALQKAEVTADAVGDMLVDRYGSIESAKRTMQEDPVGAMGDVLTILGVPAGAVAKIAPSGKIGKIAKTVSAIETAAEPTALVTRAAVKLPKVLRPKVKSTNAAIKAMGESISIKPNRANKIKRLAGTTPEQWLIEREFRGTSDKIASDLMVAADASKKFVDESLAKFDDVFQEPSAIQALDELEKTLDGIAGMEDQLSEIVKLKEVVAEGATLKQLNQVKRSIDKTTDLFKTTGEVREAARAKGLVNIRRKIQKRIEAEAEKLGVKDIAEANKQTQISREISDAISDAAPPKVKRLLPTVKELIAPVAIGATGNIPLAVGVLAFEKLAGSSSVMSWLANRLSKLPKKQLIGIEKAAKTRKFSPAQSKALRGISDEMVQQARLIEKSNLEEDSTQ